MAEHHKDGNIILSSQTPPPSSSVSIFSSKRGIVSLVIILFIGIEGISGEIQGKWSAGIGIKSLQNLSPAIPVLWRVSKETALVGNIFLETSEFDNENFSAEENPFENTLTSSSSRTTAVGFGLELREYFKSEEKISPYVGIEPAVSFSGSKNSYSENILWRFYFDINAGLEYFVKENLSLSTHINFLRYFFEDENFILDGERGLGHTLHQLKFKPNSSLIFRFYFK